MSALNRFFAVAILVLAPLGTAFRRKTLLLLLVTILLPLLPANGDDDTFSVAEQRLAACAARTQHPPYDVAFFEMTQQCKSELKEYAGACMERGGSETECKISADEFAQSLMKLDPVDVGFINCLRRHAKNDVTGGILPMALLSLCRGVGHDFESACSQRKPLSQCENDMRDLAVSAYMSFCLKRHSLGNCQEMIGSQ